MEQDELTAASQQIVLADRLLSERRLGAATEAYRRAEAMGVEPDRCAGARWMIAMLEGEFGCAWAESDAIRAMGGDDPHRFWTGEDVAGKRVIVRCLHGFGDAIQFLRYIPRLRAVASHVIVEAPPRMLEVTPLLRGLGEVITWGELAPVRPPEWDVQVEVTELPYLFRTMQTELPLATEYLRVPEEERMRAAAQMGIARGLRVGLVWAAGGWNRERSVPIESLESLVLSGCAEFWSLQGGEAQDEAAAWVSGGTMRDAAECGDGMRALAAVVANLDIVISVDTLAVHMAGAMGKPAWVLLHYAADWRWMVERRDSPWYPTARLFRQAAPGGWTEVLEQVRAQLASAAADATVKIGPGGHL